MPRVLEDPAAMADALRAVRNGTAWRGESLARKVAHAQRLGLDLTLETDPREIDDALERHIGSVDLLDAVWLRQATAAADAVAQLATMSSNTRPSREAGRFRRSSPIPRCSPATM